MTKETIYVTRPKGKPEVTTKGKMNEWSNGYREFIPQGSRESQRQMLKQLGDSSFYKTEGKRDSSYSLHLNVSGESIDPVAEMWRLFLLLTEAERKQMPQMPEGSQGRMLHQDDARRLQIWLDEEQHQVSIMARLACSLDIERQLLQMQADMGRVIGRHRSDIINLIK